MLIIAGAGHDAVPVADLALRSGFAVTILDARSHLNNERSFPNAYHLVKEPEEMEKGQLQNGWWIIMNHHQMKDEAAMIFLGDQPFVPNQVVHTLLTEYECNKEKGIHIVRPRYVGELGHPILFDTRLFKHFTKIEGDEGGRSIIRNHKE